MGLKSVLLEQFAELFAELATEDTAESFDGQEESTRRVYPLRTTGSKAAGRNDVVYVGMNFEVLAPRMEYAEESDVSSEVLGIASQFEHRRGAGAEEQIVEQPLVLEDQIGEFVRQCE